jgi:hypothetical protein
VMPELAGLRPFQHGSGNKRALCTAQ